MILNGPKLEKKQVLLGRFVEIGAELFAMAAAMGYAKHLIDSGRVETSVAADRDDLVATVRYFCKLSRGKVDRLFNEIRSNADREGYRLARTMID
jgi:hypothetical protein